MYVKYRIYKFKEWFRFFKFRFKRFFNKSYDGHHDDIKEIQLSLENLDCISFPRKYIGKFYIGNVKTEYSRYGCNYIGETTIAYEFKLEIKNDANVQENNVNYGKRHVFDRITSYNDICAIDIIYKTGKKKSFYFDYDEGENEGMLGADNINQKSRINKFGDLELVIGKGMELDNCFPKDQEESERDFKWDMYE